VKHISEVNPIESQGSAAPPAATFREDRWCVKDCPICGGVGVVRVDAPIGSPLFGKITPCDNLPLSSPVYNASGLDEIERLKYSWDSVLDMDETNRIAVQEVKKIVDRGYGVAYLWGKPGLAKSLILKVAVIESIKARPGYWHKYTMMSAIIDNMRSAYGKEVENPAKRLRQITNDYLQFPTLAIDELGIDSDTPFSLKRQFLLIDERYTKAIELQQPFITVIASNLTPDELPAPLKSRLWDGRCFQIEMKGEDFRLGAEW